MWGDIPIEDMCMYIQIVIEYIIYSSMYIEILHNYFTWPHSRFAQVLGKTMPNRPPPT